MNIASESTTPNRTVEEPKRSNGLWKPVLLIGIVVGMLVLAKVFGAADVLVSLPSSLTALLR